MVLDYNMNSQIGIELSTRKPMYIGHDWKTERQIKFIYWIVTEMSETKLVCVNCPEYSGHYWGV